MRRRDVVLIRRALTVLALFGGDTRDQIELPPCFGVLAIGVALDGLALHVASSLAGGAW